MMRHLLIFGALIVLSWAGCAGRTTVSEKASRPEGDNNSFESQFGLNGGQSADTGHADVPKHVTRLSEADARRIADEVVRTNRGFGGYSCKHIFYEEKPTSAGSIRRWILTYAPPSEAPDFEVFIEVNDADGKAKAHR